MSRILLSSTVGDVVRALEQSGEDAVVVWERSAPIGVITVHDLTSEGAGQSPQALVADVMSHECVAIDPTADERATEHQYLEAAWVSLQRRRPLSDDTLERRAEGLGRRDLTSGPSGQPLPTDGGRGPTPAVAGPGGSRH